MNSLPILSAVKTCCRRLAGTFTSQVVRGLADTASSCIPSVGGAVTTECSVISITSEIITVKAFNGTAEAVGSTRL